MVIENEKPRHDIEMSIDFSYLGECETSKVFKTFEVF